MSKRAGAKRKVLGLLALANDPASTASEKELAKNKVVELRLKYGISDMEIEVAKPIEDVGIFGLKLFGYHHVARPIFQRIKEAVLEVEASVAELESKDRLDVLSHFYADFRDLLDNRYSKSAIKQQRDLAIKEVYTAYYEEHLRERSKDPTDLWEQQWAHDHAITMTKFHGRDLRADTIERIVGRSGAGLSRQIAKKLQAEEDEKEAAAT